MTSVVSALGDRVDPAPFTALVALGDLACIGVFVLVGSVSGHGLDPATQAGRIAETYAVFVAGWAVAALPAGLYETAARRSAKRAILRTAPAWVVAALVAQGLRLLPGVHGGAALTFYLVSVGVGLALLLPWRVAASRFGPRD